MNDYLSFYYPIYLECVSNQTRCHFLEKYVPPDKRIDRNSMEGKTQLIESFIEYIQTARYPNVLDEFRKFMNANIVYCFQAMDGSPLDIVRTMYGDIVLLSISHSEKKSPPGDEQDPTENKKIKLLRSELLDFYANYDDSNTNKQAIRSRPRSELLLDIKDTVRIVRVNEHQQDESVSEYDRQPCLISYVSFVYRDDMDGKRPEKRLYFAFVYENTDDPEIPEKIKNLRGFLSFRYYLVERISKDFNGRLYSERVQMEWKQEMLAIERAGSHSDSSTLTDQIEKYAGGYREIIEAQFESNKIRTDSSAQPKQPKRNYKSLTGLFVINNLIAMYYRTAIAATYSEHEIRLFYNKNASNDAKFETIGDLLRLSIINSPKINIDDGVYDYVDNPDNLSVFYKKSKKNPMRRSSDLTFEPKYLRAFLADVLNNVNKHSEGATEKEVELSVEENPGNNGTSEKSYGDYIVFKNKCRKMPDQTNYKLKAAIEMDQDIPVENHRKMGISMGSMAHDVGYGGKLIAYYKDNDDGTREFCIKLPILNLQKRQRGALVNGCQGQNTYH